MATTSPSAPNTVQIAGLTNSQQQADGLPAYAIFANIPGSAPLPGPRSAGLSSVAVAQYDSAGFPLASPQDPTSPPPVGTMYLSSRAPRWIGKPEKPMWEPSVFVAGKGWVNSANS